MPDRSFIKIFFTFLFVVLIMNSNGQTTNKSNNGFTDDLQINFNLGFTEFYGDASNNGYFKKFSGEIAFSSGITVRKYLSPVFGVGVNLWYSGLKSHKDRRATGDTANFLLTGKYFDGNLNLLIDFSNLFWGPSSRKLSVYGTLGLGYASWNSQLADSITGIILNSGDALGDNSYKKGGFVFPIGLGVNYMLSNTWALNFEMNLRTVLNDDVDVWRDGFKYDQPLYTSIGVSYFINRKAKSKPKTVRVKSQQDKKTAPEEVPLSEIPFYDYRVGSDSQKKSGNADPDVITIKAPVDKKTDVSPDITYRVQVLAKRDKLPSFNYIREKLNIVGDIYENYQDGIYRYSTGSFNTYQEAVRHSYLMKDKGVVDAFVVAYKNDIRIHITGNMKSN